MSRTGWVGTIYTVKRWTVLKQIVDIIASLVIKQWIGQSYSLTCIQTTSID